MSNNSLRNVIKINTRLETIRRFQANYPTSAVGGSFGLFLLGYDLKRNLGISDIDVVTKFFIPPENEFVKILTPSGSDFDYAYYDALSKIKVDVKINKEVIWYVNVTFEGYTYRVYHVMKFSGIKKNMHIEGLKSI